MTMQEVWKPVKGFEGHYEVSSDGRVKSLKFGRNLVMKTRIHKTGYYVIMLRLDGTPKQMKVHRMLAEAFIPNIDELPEVNHKNGVKLDNRLENLEWCSHRDNVVHAFGLGLIPRVSGEAHPKAKLTEKDVMFIRGSKATVRKLGKQFGVSKSLISDVKRGNIWRSV